MLDKAYDRVVLFEKAIWLLAFLRVQALLFIFRSAPNHQLQFTVDSIFAS